MHADRGLTGSAVPLGAGPSVPPLQRRAVREAAIWMTCLRAEDATDADRAACRAWRAADPEHERAWQRAEEVNRRFGLVPQGLGARVLEHRPRAGRRAGLKAFGLFALASPVAWLAYRSDARREWAADQRTAVGERRELRLADGSRLHLNTATAVDVAFDARQRLLHLVAGELLIETAPDPAAASGAGRPFVVRTADGLMRALGTRFSVRRDAGTTRLAVLDGAVEVQPHAASIRPQVLRAGHQLRFSVEALGAPEALTPNAEAWSRGVLVADRMPLGEFAAELGRYRPGVLQCDPAVAALRISGAFQLADTDRVLAAVAATLPVAVVYRTRYWAALTAPA